MKKRWAVIILILIVVAVVLAIVFINLFTDKTTKQLTKDLHSSVTDGYLAPDNEASKETIKYLDRLIALNELKDERAYLENVKYSYNAYQVLAGFINSEMVFTKYTDVYRANRKAISNSLKAANTNAYNIFNYVKANNEKVNGSNQWLALTYTDTKEDIQNLLTNTQNAALLLQQVHLSCVQSTYFNNPFVKEIFAQADKFGDAVKENQADSGKQFLEFVNAYLFEDNVKKIISYPTDITLQEKVKDIAEKGNQSQFYDNFISGKLPEGGV